MKKIIAVTLAILAVLSVATLFVSAEGDPGAKVYVTLVDDNSAIIIAYQPVTVTDSDSDGKLTITDALYCAHEEFYTGGAAEGYATEMTKWGLSLMKLWGVANGGSYGYLVNDEFAWNLTDPVQEGDYLAAYIYTDTEHFSDKYSYFDVKTVQSEEPFSLTLTLKTNGYDAEGAPERLPVKDAKLLINGRETDVKTDADGKATVTVEESGVISAVSDSQLIVPPVCRVTIKPATPATTEPAADPTEAAADPTETAADPTEAVTPSTGDASTGGPSTGDAATPDTATPDAATKDTATKDSVTKSTTTSPKTNDVTKLWLWIVISAVCLCGAVAAVIVYIKKYAKK